MQLYYDNQTYSPPPGNSTTIPRNKHNQGVTVTAPGYGDVDTVAYLDADKTVGVWENIIGNLTAAGYQPKVNLRAAPVLKKYFPILRIFSVRLANRPERSR